MPKSVNLRQSGLINKLSPDRSRRQHRIADLLQNPITITLLSIVLLTFSGSTTYAATYKEYEKGSVKLIEIEGEAGEGIQIIDSPKPILFVSASFMCENPGQCSMSLSVVYMGRVDNAPHPVAVVIPGDDEPRRRFSRNSVISETLSAEYVIVNDIAKSARELQSIPKIRVLSGNRSSPTEVLVDTSKFDLSRLQAK